MCRRHQPAKLKLILIIRTDGYLTYSWYWVSIFQWMCVRWHDDILWTCWSKPWQREVQWMCVRWQDDILWTCWSKPWQREVGCDAVKLIAASQHNSRSKCFFFKLAWVPLPPRICSLDLRVSPCTSIRPQTSKITKHFTAMRICNNNMNINNNNNLYCDKITHYNWYNNE